MELRVKMRPIILTGKTKSELNNYIRFGASTISSYGSYQTDFRNKLEDVAIVYNLIKQNVKYKQERYKTGPKKGKYKSSVKVRDKKWIAYVYKFPLSMLKTLNISVHQGSHNFTIKYRR